MRLMLTFGKMLVFAVICCNAPAAQQGRTISPHGPVRPPCESCHTTISWSPIRAFPDFNHQATRYPLEGKHSSLECRQCHLQPVFTSIGARCADCHADIHRRRMGSNCEECHTPRSWSDVVRRPNSHTNRFPLMGAHAAAQCSDCHTGAATGLFRGQSTDCYSCHADAYLNAKTIDHRAAGFSERCETCHSTDNWLRGFNHQHFTGFALSGAHTSLSCLECHAGGKFAGTQAACDACHLDEYNRTTNPSHIQAGFSRECSVCHTSSSWEESAFNHTATRFPLTGAHASQTCGDCHKNGQYSGLATACESCHLDSFNTATNPNHVVSGFPHDCSTCHSTSAWTPALFDHARTQFPLTGAHSARLCTDCHKNGQYAGLPAACVSCHLTAFNNTTNPNHANSGFPQECAVCHNTSSWTPAVFDHNKTSFNLTGSHTSAACASCHISGVYAGTPRDCYSCHSSEYNSATDPNHASALFPKDCSQCHTTVEWSGASFDHPRFPIYRGSHSGEWTACNDCHPNSNNYSSFSCLNCHEHEKASMDSEHRGESNYVYNSANCYSCHPNGEAD